ncbi:hypothetical protein PRZ48_002190 [Zasmidium cellare]|uniref:Uncharacterized protein n=1 Tax=Zasmidium cellare TaxID=395010 RepID=A0ABR0F3C0_ZASCE|nr:hypothetical protein PRZ48_002190 [Zasmidium cellare]
MGRRPHAVVKYAIDTLYFTQTCKKLTLDKRVFPSRQEAQRCEQSILSHVFPKGRAELLVGHLLRRCPMISQEDRQRVYQAVNHGSEVRRQGQQSRDDEPPPSPANPLVDYTAGLHPSFLPARDDDGLHTLAEASQLAGETPHEQSSAGNNVQYGIGELDFVKQLQTAAHVPSIPNEPVTEPAHTPASDDSSHASQLPPPVDAVNDASVPSPLMQTASAANQELEHFRSHALAPGTDQRTFDDGAAPGDFASFLQSNQANGNYGQTSWGPTNASNDLAFGNMTATMHGRIEVRMFRHSNLTMTLHVKKHVSRLVNYMSSIGDNISPYTSDRRIVTGKNETATADIWLLDTREKLSPKIEEYLNRVADACIAEEPSPFLKATLERAQEMVRQEQANGYKSLQAQNGRSSYAIANELLKDTVELWVATYILTLRSPSEIEAIYNSAEAPSDEATPSQWTGQQDTQYTSLPPNSRSLIFAQLLASTESRCLTLAKSVMNELERRLLQRSQVSGFATVIASTVLLNCIERMSGLYRTFDAEPSPPQAANSLPHRPPNWPLDAPPRLLWPQGDYFANILIMLLRTRKLPPKTTTSGAGRLIVSQGQTLPFSVNRSYKEQSDDATKLPARWLNRLALQVSELERLRDGRVPGGEKGVREWDLRFISRLLLPEVER